jgi:hypothetical protein
MSSDLIAIFLLALAATVNPTLFAATTLMLVMPNPRRLMFGFLCGALTVSVTVGLLIVFALNGTGFETASRTSVGPIEDLVLGGLALLAAAVLRTGRDEPIEERHREKAASKQAARREAGKPSESRSVRMLRTGDPRVTCAVGGALSFPGVLYLDALDHIHKLQPGTVATVLLVVCFCVAQLALLELPLLGSVFWPDRAEATVARFKAWLARDGRTAAVVGSTVVGIWLVARGVTGLL